MVAVIEYLFYSLFFFVPLLLWPKTSEVFEFNKMLFTYGVTILISAAWVARWVQEKKVTIRRTPLDLPIALFFLSQLLSTIFSIDTHTSIWGYYSRFHGGLASTVAYIALYYALVTNIKREKIIFLVYSILGSAILVALYGVLEHFGIDKHLWVQDVQNRVFSTLGQPNWLSAYLAALLPLPIILAVAAKKLSRRLIWLGIALLFFITILYTKSQSGIFTTFLILALIPIYLVGKKHKLVYLLAGILFLAGLAYKWDFVQKLSPFGPPNLAQLVEKDRAGRIGGSDSMIIRQVVWQGARELALKNPIFGTGVETFGYSYYTVRPALHNLLSEWEFLYNKAHNEYLNLLANTGFVGLTTYLLLIGWTIIWWQRKKDKTPLSDGLFLGYLSILVTNYFGFSVVPVALFFFLFPAITLIQAKDKEVSRSINFHINSYLAYGLITLAALYLIMIPINQLRADLAYNRARLYLQANAIKQSLDNAKDAVRLEPEEPLFTATLAESAAAAAATIKKQLDTMGASISAEVRGEGEKMLFDLTNDALKNSARAVAMNPHHANLRKSKAKTELYLGTIDAKYNRQALETLIELTKIAPTDAKVLYNIAILHLELGEEEKGREALRKAIELKPDYDAAKALLYQ